MKKKVVITGIGMVCPCGNGKDATWANVKAGKSGISRITKFDPSRCTCQIAGEVKDFDAYAAEKNYLDAKAARYAPQLAAYAAALSRIFERPVKENLLYFFDCDAAVHPE